VVFVPKFRRKIFYDQISKELDPVLAQLARQKECTIIRGHFMQDHVHILISIPLKYSVAQVIGYIKGKSAIYIARNYDDRMRNFTGEQFWARGYFVSTVGRDEEAIRKYIQHQEKADKRLDQLSLM
jgi:putative transposase